MSATLRFWHFLMQRASNCLLEWLICTRKKDHQSLLLFPTMAHETLALELYLKCLHKIRRRNKWGHNITQLFNNLSNADKKTISKSLIEIASQHANYAELHSLGVSFDAKSVAQRASNAFEKARYWWELNLPSADDQGHVSNAGIGNFSEAVVRLILKLRPDWNERFKLFRLDLPGIGRLPT